MSTVSMTEIAAKQRQLLLLKKVRSNQPLTASELKELKAFEDMTAQPTKPAAADTVAAVIASQKEAAAYCGVSTRTLRNWEKEHMLKDADGHYIRERLDERIAEREIDSNPLKTRILTADAEHKEVRAELGRMQLKVRMGELVPKEQIETDQIKRVLETRRVLLNLVRKLPPQLKGKTYAQQTDLIRKEVYYALNVFAGREVEDIGPADEICRLWEDLSPAQKNQLKKQLIGRTGKRKRKK